jgi:hypothetical protein
MIVSGGVAGEVADDVSGFVHPSPAVMHQVIGDDDPEIAGAGLVGPAAGELRGHVGARNHLDGYAVAFKIELPDRVCRIEAAHFAGRGLEDFAG